MRMVALVRLNRTAASSLMLVLAGAAWAASSPQGTINTYCVACHNNRAKTGGLSLENKSLDVSADPETWEKVVKKLQLGVMPPAGIPRPDPETYAGLLRDLTTRLDAALAKAAPGAPLLHRLNRAEYANAIRDLLGFHVDVSSLLPPDNAAYGFDNVAEVLGNSPALLQAYLNAARKISAAAVGDPTIPAGSDTYTVPQDLSQDHHLEDLPLGTVGGMRARHTFPTDGEYELQVRLYRTNLSAIRGLEQPHTLEIALDGERVHLAEIGGEKDLVPLQANPSTTSDRLEAERLRIRRFIKAGERDITAAFLDEVSPRMATIRLERFQRDFNPYDAEGAPHVQSITVLGPFSPKASDQPPSPNVFSCRPQAEADQFTCARQILTRLATRAYRRPTTAAEIDGLVDFYKSGRTGQTFEAGIELGLRRILASPAFVYRPEIEPANLAPGTNYRLTDYELASRLSFFLWSSIPDEELLRVAGEGRLNQTDVLAAQAARMLADPRSQALIDNFAGQWLQLRNLRGIVPDNAIFPDFDDNLRQAFRKETELFFESVLRENRSALDLLNADYTFVNERLAKHYGIANVTGSDFRRVTLTEETRRGLLGKGAILLVTSHANTTSPVLRGKWVLENLMGSPPPPPPPNVPALKETAAGAAPRTMREQMEQHRQNPACINCHLTMDPIGFAMENFDVVGTWRTKSEAGIPLNTADRLADGTQIDGVIALRNAILARPDVFVQTLTQKLLIYGLGRGLTYADMPAVRRIVRESDGYRMNNLILGIVRSDAFRMRAKSADRATQPAVQEKVAAIGPANPQP
jgi:cytochrome c551/c552